VSPLLSAAPTSRLAAPERIGVVDALRHVDLGAARALAVGGAELVTLHDAQASVPGGLDLVAATGPAAAMTAARLALDLDVPLLVMPDAAVPEELGHHLEGATVTTHRALTYRLDARYHLAVAEVHVHASDQPLRVSMDTGAGVIAEDVSGDGVRVLSSMQLPGWSRPYTALDPRLAAVALADGREGRPRIRAVLPSGALLYVTCHGRFEVVADRTVSHTVAADGAVYLGPHDATLRLVTLPGLDSHSQALAGQQAGLGRFARRVTTSL
jgi:hypothetical protein